MEKSPCVELKSILVIADWSKTKDLQKIELIH